MSAFKIKKTMWLRRRFVVSQTLPSIDDWMDVSQNLRQEILTASTFNQVGDKTHLVVDSQSKTARVFIEVLGIPKIGLEIQDIEPSEVLSYSYPEDQFNVDFLTIHQQALALMAAVAEVLRPEYHIVVEGENLALHFFIQKDYIHHVTS